MIIRLAYFLAPGIRPFRFALVALVNARCRARQPYNVTETRNVLHAGRLLTIQCSAEMLTRPEEHEAKAELRTHTSTRVFQHQHYVSRTIINAVKKHEFFKYFVTHPALAGSIWSCYKSTLTENFLHQCRTGRYAQNTLQHKLK